MFMKVNIFASNSKNLHEKKKQINPQILNGLLTLFALKSILNIGNRKCIICSPSDLGPLERWGLPSGSK